MTDRSRGEHHARERLRLLAAFDALEEVTRALIAWGDDAVDELFALLTAASNAVHESRFEDARAALGQLHFLAMHGAKR